MIQRALLAVALMAATAAPGLAQTQMETMEQTDKEARAADKQLNQVYRQLIKQLDKQSQKELVASELAWIKFRDAEVAFNGGLYRGGSIQTTIELSTALKLTKARTAQLQEQLDEMNRH